MNTTLRRVFRSGAFFESNNVVRLAGVRTEPPAFPCLQAHFAKRRYQSLREIARIHWILQRTRPFTHIQLKVRSLGKRPNAGLHYGVNRTTAQCSPRIKSRQKPA